MKDKWIQEALKDHKRNLLGDMLGIAESDDIPLALLSMIIAAKIGEMIHYNRKSIKVTKLLKKRAVLARTLKRLRR